MVVEAFAFGCHQAKQKQKNLFLVSSIRLERKFTGT